MTQDILKHHNTAKRTTKVTDEEKEKARVVIDRKYFQRLQELGELLGHSSISQTVDYLLKEHLDKELNVIRHFYENKNI